MSFAAVLDRLQRLESPFPGLRPFEVQESHLFFGRDVQIAELVTRLERNRFLAVLGVSGSGKSSLVRAGLIPALERGSVSDAGRRWRIVVARPGGRPFDALAACLGTAGLDASGLRRSSHGLIEIAQQLAHDESLLVVVDQFEELFRYKDFEPVTGEARQQQTSAATDAAEFVQLLLASSRHQPPVYIVITMRSDYLGDCAEFRDLPETLNDCQYLVPRLTREQRKEAIEGPLGRAQAAPSVVQRMLNDAGDEPDQLPVLQHALMRTWTRWRATDPSNARRIELQDYETIGGFESALNQHADELLTSVPAEIAATVFKRLTARGRSNRERRDPATLRELWAVCGATTPDQTAAVTAVVDHFRRGEATFLAPRDGEIGPDTYIDITHESLIRQWKKLRDEWLPEERRSVKTLLELVQRAAKWKAHEGELLGGLDLFDALAWERQRNRAPAWAGHYVDAADLDGVLAFIKASAADERKRAFRTRTLWVAAPLLVLVGALGVYAVYKSLQAAQLTRFALARQMTTRAELLLTEQVDIEPALLLATDALQRADDAESARVVREAAALLPRIVARFDHPAAISSVAFSADGRQVITTAADETVRVFDLAGDKKEVRHMALSGMKPRALSADGRRVAWLTDAGMAVVADVATGEELRRVAVSGKGALALSPIGRYLASIEGKDGDSVGIFDVASGARVATIAHPHPFLAVVVSDGGLVATGNGAVRRAIRPGIPQTEPATANSAAVFKLPGGARISRLGHNGPVQAVAFTPDGRYVATGSEDKTARVFDAEIGNEIARLTHQDAVNAVAFSADGRWVATGSDDKTARVFEAATGLEVAHLTHQRKVTAVAFSPDSHQIVTGSEDNSARVIEMTGAAELWRVTREQHVTSAAFDATGQRLIVGSGDMEEASAEAFEASTGTSIFSFKQPESELRSVGISADGRLVVVGGGAFGGATRVFRIGESTRPVLEIKAPNPVTALGISGDGRRVVTLGIDETVRIFDADREIGTIAGTSTQAIALSADGRTLVVGGGKTHSGTLRVLDLPEVGKASSAGGPTWKEVAEFSQSEPTRALALSEDGRWIAAASGMERRDLNLYRLGPAAVLSRNDENVSAIALTASAGLLATGDDEGFVRVRDLATGKEIANRVAAGGPIVDMRLVEGGRYLIAAVRPAAGRGHVVAVIRQSLRAGDLIAEACSRVTRNLTKEEWKKYVGPDVVPSKTCPSLP